MESEQLSHLFLTYKVLIGNVEKITTHIDEKEKSVESECSNSHILEKGSSC